MPLDEHNCLYMSVLKTTKLQSPKEKFHYTTNRSWMMKTIDKISKNSKPIENMHTYNDLQNGLLIYVILSWRHWIWCPKTNSNPYAIARKMSLDEKGVVLSLKFFL